MPNAQSYMTSTSESTSLVDNLNPSSTSIVSSCVVQNEDPNTSPSPIALDPEICDCSDDDATGNLTKKEIEEKINTVRRCCEYYKYFSSNIFVPPISFLLSPEVSMMHAMMST